MKKVLLAAGIFALAGCGQGEEQSPARTGSDEVAIGGFSIGGPAGRDISIPATTVERQVVEDYVQDVRPIIEGTARDVSRFVDPSVELRGRTLSVSIESGSLEEARATVESGLEDLQQVQPPEDLEAVHELLVAAYVQALAAYDNVIEAFGSGDVDALADAVRENLPEIEQFAAEARAILQELERAATVNPDNESRG